MPDNEEVQPLASDADPVEQEFEPNQNESAEEEFVTTGQLSKLRSQIEDEVRRHFNSVADKQNATLQSRLDQATREIEKLRREREEADVSERTYDQQTAYWRQRYEEAQAKLDAMPNAEVIDKTMFAMSEGFSEALGRDWQSIINEMGDDAQDWGRFAKRLTKMAQGNSQPPAMDVEEEEPQPTQRKGPQPLPSGYTAKPPSRSAPVTKYKTQSQVRIAHANGEIDNSQARDLLSRLPA